MAMRMAIRTNKQIKIKKRDSLLGRMGESGDEEVGRREREPNATFWTKKRTPCLQIAP
jgi:hypothetical protein